ncbi:MAG: M48 family metalloprotease [Terracidiphilus sp.]
MTFRKISITLLCIALTVPCAYARKTPRYARAHPLTPEQAALVDKAISREKVLIQEIRQRTPLVETYIQNIRPDEKLYEVPVSDDYMLDRIDFGKGFFDEPFLPRSTARQGFFRGSLAAMTRLSKALGLDSHFTYNPLGFTEMMFIDPQGFDTQHYVFSYVRREFLGSVRTSVYDVHPRVRGMGRFFGRIWIEDQGGNIVRFNGTYTGPRNDYDSRYFFHFDSWRMNLQPGIWLPVAVYVEETGGIDGRKSLGLKAQTHFWGYSLKLPASESENVSMTVENAIDKSDDSQDVGPLQASRNWVTEAENNVIDRLVEAGLVAPLTPGGYEDKVLDQIIINLEVPNNLVFINPVHARILLTDTIEATTVGNTILISKGLIDTLPSEEAIASVMSMELAHIQMGHHIDTRYAFNDRLMFPDEATFQRIDMAHSSHDNTVAAKQAMQYLENSMYKDRMASAGLYYEQLVAREKALKELNTPRLGDSLLQPDGTPWMAQLEKMAPPLNWDNLNQRPALPLGSWLKVDPWSDRVQQLDAQMYAYMNPRDKMPFEVTPIYFKLKRYDAQQQPASPTAAGAQEPVSGDGASAQSSEVSPSSAQSSEVSPSSAQ